MWFVVFGIASTIYRVFILIRILLFLTNRLPRELKFLAIGFALVSGTLWVCIPVGKFIKYLATNGELMRVRPRAVLTTLVFVAAVVIGLGGIPVTDRCRVEGIVEPVNMAVVHAGENGILESFLPQPDDGAEVAEGTDLLDCTNPDLKTRHEVLLAEREKLLAQRRKAQTEEPAAAQIYSEQIAAKDEEIQRVEEKLAALKVRASFAGAWIAPKLDQAHGGYLRRGTQVGLLADLDELMIRAVADQTVAANIREAKDEVEIRIQGRADMELTGKKSVVLPAGLKRLPSAALGYAAGGSMQIDPKDQKGTATMEPFFEVHVIPDKNSKVTLLSGQRVVVRFTMPEDKPLLVQWWRDLRQLLQRRFGV